MQIQQNYSLSLDTVQGINKIAIILHFKSVTKRNKPNRSDAADRILQLGLKELQKNPSLMDKL